MSDFEAQVLAAAAELVRVFGAHDREAYFASFAPEATFIFYNHPDRLVSRQAYREVWEGWELEGFHVNSCASIDPTVQVLSDELALFSHSVRTELAGEPEASNERETIVFALRDGRWLAIHEHLSPLPDLKPQEA